MNRRRRGLIAQASNMLTKRRRQKTRCRSSWQASSSPPRRPTTEFYPMAARSADTRKIMEKPAAASPERAVIPVQTVAVSKDGSRIATG